MVEVALYGFVVAATVVLGYAIGHLVPLSQVDIRLFLVVPLAPTPASLAVFGASTVAVALGVPLSLVYYVSQDTG